MEQINILIFPSATGTSREIFDSLKFIRWINIIGADSDIKNFSHYEFKNLEINAPFITNENDTILYLQNLIKKHNIKCIYPAFDSVMLFLKKHENILNVEILTSPYKTCQLCISKRDTYNKLQNVINVPKIYNKEQVTCYPVFIKPDKGYGSRNSYKVNDNSELIQYTKLISDHIICEFLPGDEYTIDCFTSNRKLIFCEGRQRTKAVNGLSILTEHRNNSEFIKIAEIINNNIEFIGSWFFQVKYNVDTELTLLEIAPRIPGAASLHRSFGYNGPLLSIYNYLGYPINYININKYENNVSCYKTYENKYNLNLSYDTVYVDLDDTIIIKDKINIEVIKFLYYCKNETKKIVLITRNTNPINKLQNFIISEYLFDEIKIVKENEKKSMFITDKNSIFIDDSFIERDDVYKNSKIYVFNCDAIKSLYNEKY
jgi:predicted ATP-grasp superfamily ATP-dependent carboligase